MKKNKTRDLKHSNKFLVFAIHILFSAICIVLIFRLTLSLGELKIIKENIAEVQCKINTHNNANNFLENKIIAMNTNHDIIETYVRSHLNYIRPNELVIVF